jgi:broad specificity phosphatase PhoE
MTLYLVRHGETQWNVEGRLQGRMDSPLTSRGIEQVRRYAALLCAELASATPVRICSSPLPRARQTASLLLELLGVPSAHYGESDLLAERSCGTWEGLRWDEIEAQHGADARSRWRQWHAAAGNDGESLAQVHARAKAWLSLPPVSSPTIVVTHGVMSRVFRGAYLGLDEAGTMALDSHDQETLYALSNANVRALRSSDLP